MIVRDREAADVLVTESVGKTRSLTPEGFLFCEGVRISSTKPMLYRASEIPEVEPSNGMVVMNREPDVLFSAVTLASFQGKPVTDEHPEDLVSPSDWKDKTVGVVLNPRQGEGDEAEYLIADLLITDEGAIQTVQNGRKEVSCGYDGEREQVSPGVGRFTRIIGNHVALVDRGRCGPACAIGDEDMTAKRKRSVFDRLRTAFKAKDEAAFEEELQNAETEMTDEGDEPQKVVIELRTPDSTAPVGTEETSDEGETAPPADPMAEVMRMLAEFGARLDAIEAGVAPNASAEAAETQAETTDESSDETEEKKDDDKKDEGDAKTMDAATVSVVRTEFQDVIAKAEILAPGIKLPTFDAKASKKTMADAMCGLRKAAMSKAIADDKRKPFVTAILGASPVLDKMSCDALSIAFNGAVELARAANNSARPNIDHLNFRQGPMDAARLQKMIEERRKGTSAA